MTKQHIPKEALDAAREVLRAQCPEVSAKHEQHWPAAIWRAAIRAAGDSNGVGDLDRQSAAAGDGCRAAVGMRPLQDVEE